MVEMKLLSVRDAGLLLDDFPKAMQLVHQTAQAILEADLTVQLVNAVLSYVWYEVVCTGKLGTTPDKSSNFWNV